MNINLQRLKDNWADLKGFLKKQVDCLEDVKERHEEDVDNYKQFVDYIEPSSLKEKLQGALAKLEKATRNLDKPVEKLREKRDILLAHRDREQTKLEEMEQKNAKIRAKVDMPEDMKQSSSQKVQGMRDQMNEMRNKMKDLEKNAIDIGRNPAKAIETISNPLLDKLQEEVNTGHQPKLEENMFKKGKLESEETDLNAQIYDQQMQQVSIREQINDQKYLTEDMKEDIENLQE